MEQKFCSNCNSALKCDYCDNICYIDKVIIGLGITTIVVECCIIGYIIKILND